MGEIVQVQGGHIIRATGRKDRHSKVYTAKGPRDRRVRLSAHTAIQFYDVQDRLGYDRPSKAVDWLMKKAKSAIDKLDELPPFDPVAGPSGGGANVVDVAPVDLGAQQSEPSRFEIGEFHHHQQGPAAGNPMSFSGYPHQDLCLSLQSFQNPGLDPGNPNSSHPLFPSGFEAGPSTGPGAAHWPPPEANLGEMGHFQRLLSWTGAGAGLGFGAGERGTLQSNFNPPQSIRAWDDLPIQSSSDDHRIPKPEIHQGMHHQQHHQLPMAAPGIGILGSDGFMGYCVPAAALQMQGAGEDVHSITVAYHQNSASSMSADSSR